MDTLKPQWRVIKLIQFDKDASEIHKDKVFLNLYIEVSIKCILLKNPHLTKFYE